MAAVASKNLYELLGNDHDEDSDKEPEPPVKVIDKTPARTDKRNAPREAPTGGPTAGATRGGRRGDLTGNEAAFRDHKGSSSNRGKPTEDIRSSEQKGGRAPGTYSDRGGRGRGRGGRGGPRGDFDRHSRGLAADSEKQAGHGWGANEGGAELADEQAGEAIAKADEKDALTGDGADAPVDAAADAEAEPEDNSISYADYLAQQAEKLSLAAPEGRKPNEGTKEDKKWANAKAISKEEEEAFIAGSGGKAKRERERKQKQVLEIDQRFVEAPERGGRGDGPRGRGGRGRGDGSRGRGDGFRGGRGDARGGRGGEFRGRGRGDGAPRGAPRGGPRGGAPINTEDTNAFPSLGS